MSNCGLRIAILALGLQLRIRISKGGLAESATRNSQFEIVRGILSEFARVRLGLNLQSRWQRSDRLRVPSAASRTGPSSRRSRFETRGHAHLPMNHTAI